MRFFVPELSGGEAEAAYARMAVRAGATVVPRNRRIYSIVFTHRGVVWTAAVGSPLTGSREQPTIQNGRIVSVWETRTDPAMVVAIFPGRLSYTVFTNLTPGAETGSIFTNPFLAPTPEAVQQFDG